MKKILLLNLPFERPVQRDYGCPHGIKADYYWPPIDLLMFGAIVREKGELWYIDSIAGKLSETDTITEIEKIKPDIIFTILSSVTEESDARLLKKIKLLLPDVKIWASGDLIFFDSTPYEGVDFYVRDLTNRTKILELFTDNAVSGVIEPDMKNDFGIGICPHELVLKYTYSMPYSLHRHITSVLTNYGCPFKCKFCNSNMMPFKLREMEEVVEELKYIERLGIREVVFRDFTFNASDINLLCDEIIKQGIALKWSCWSRVDVVDMHVLKKMKQAGCYLISYGVESSDDKILSDMGKDIKPYDVRRTVKLTRTLGIEVLASFILGFPEDKIHQTIALMSELDPDYVAINILVPRMGSMMQDNSVAMAGERINRDSLFSEQEELVKLRDVVEKSFYLRPRKLLNFIMLSLKSRHRFFIFLKNFVGLLRRWGIR